MRISTGGTPARLTAALPLALSLILLTACSDIPPTGPRANDGAPPRTHLGVVEITISGIGDGAQTTSARAALSPLGLASPGLPGGVQAALTPAPGGDGTIQLEPLSTGSFTAGERTKGGVRYVWATYRVRNARTDSIPYDTPRRNLTFLAVDTDKTLGETAISLLRRFDGTAAAPEFAAEILPTGGVTRDLLTGAVASAGPDVLQVLTEPEAEAVDKPAGVRDVLPYGFVVRRAGDETSRTLPASPAANQFDGIVTFAFRVPLQDLAKDDPFTISFIAMAVDDDETRITQSLEEQDAAGRAAFAVRAAALGASGVTLLPGGGYGGAIPSRYVCSVRTAGAQGAPAAYLGRLESALIALAPSPAPAVGSLISRSAQISAHFDCPVDGVTPGNLIVRGLQSGQAFRGQAYTGNGTTTITTLAANFFPGEEVEVTATSSIPRFLEPFVARLRVAAGGADAIFGTERILVQTLNLYDVVPADLNGDGKLDLLAASMSGRRIEVEINDGDMSAPTLHTIPVPFAPTALAVGDLNGDGKLDFISSGDDLVEVRLGKGDGTFQSGQAYTVGSYPWSMVLGDLNGDGHLDIVTANRNTNDNSVLLGNGDGTFQAAVSYAAGNYPYTVKLSDLNGDGRLDLVTVNQVDHDISLRFGDGQGGFGAATTIAVAEWETWPTDVVAADFDGDGILDLAVTASYGPSANYVESTITILLGNGDGTFRNQGVTTITGQHGVRRIAVGDLDGDGHLDLATANFSSKSVSVLINDGTGSLQHRAHYAVDSPVPVALGDMNGDGKLDIISGDSNIYGAGYVVIFFND